MGPFLDFRLKWQFEGRTGEIRAGEESLFQRAFVKLRHELMDWSPAFEIIAEDILTPFVREQFVDQGAPGGITWQQLAPSTIQQRGGSDYPILIDKGNLLHSFTEKGGSHEQTITPRKLTWGSLVPYSVFHQTGTGKGHQKAAGVPTGPGTGRGMPMRKILSLTEDIKGQMTRTMMRRIDNVSRAIGLKRFGRGIDPGEARRIGYIALGLRG